MNKYCSKLNFPVKLNLDLTEYKVGQRNHVRGPQDILGLDLERILNAVGIKIDWVEIFYLGNSADHTIHCDGHELDDKAKLNYIVGGKNSMMTWYNPVSQDKIEKRTSRANTIYLGINTEDVVPTYSTHMEGFYLVNVGEFHNVWNKHEDRYCLSTCLVDYTTGVRLTYPQIYQRLKEYIND